MTVMSGAVARARCDAATAATRRVITPGVGTPGLLAGRGRLEQRASQHRQVGELSCGPTHPADGRSHLGGRRRDAAAAMTAASDTSVTTEPIDDAERTTPAPAVMARCRRSRCLATSATVGAATGTRNCRAPPTLSGAPMVETTSMSTQAMSGARRDRAVGPLA